MHLLGRGENTIRVVSNALNGRLGLKIINFGWSFTDLIEYFLYSLQN